MPDEKQAGLLRDLLDSALTIRAYLDGISREAFMANLEKQDAYYAVLKSSAKPPAASLQRRNLCFRTCLFAA